jgi:hypothetical protein
MCSENLQNLQQKLCSIEQCRVPKYGIIRTPIRVREGKPEHVARHDGHAVRCRLQEIHMAKQDPLEYRWPDILDITLAPAVVRLPATVPTERRNVAARTTLLRRIHREFEEMPGMSLTLAQATALFGISFDAGSRILMGLTEERVLRLRNDGRYVLRTDQT